MRKAIKRMPALGKAITMQVLRPLAAAQTLLA